MFIVKRGFLYFGSLECFQIKLSQLTRIKIDLENIADEDWQVDVKVKYFGSRDAKFHYKNLQIDIGKFPKKYFIFEPEQKEKYKRKFKYMGLGWGVNFKLNRTSNTM